MDAEFPIKVREVKVRHKSGVTYVERRQYRYDPKLGHNVVLKSERIGKIDPETNQIVPCRPKRKKNEPTQAAEPVAADNPSATRARTGLSDLFDWAGKSSGLEECVRHSFNAGGDADKILSVARYLVASIASTPGSLIMTCLIVPGSVRMSAMSSSIKWGSTKPACSRCLLVSLI